jgi:NitT/TauT family transport system substrate-binding protein
VTSSYRIARAGIIGGLLTTLVACGGGGGSTSSDSDEPSGHQVLRAVSGGGSVDFISLPVLGAIELLEEDGITVEYRYVDDGATAIQAMQQGEAELGANIGVNTGIPAVDAGATIVDVVATQRPTWALAVLPGITSMEDLEGKRIAVHGEASFTRAIADYYAEDAGITYEQLIIPGSEVRAEALAKGNVDAAVIDLPDVIQLSKTYPGAFEVLTTIGEDFPELIEQDFWVTSAWADENPELAEQVVGAILETNRRLTDDTDYALDLAKRHLPDYDESVLKELVAEYSDRGIWATDGLMTPERTLATLDFYNEVGEIEVDEVNDELLDKYFDFSYLEAALAELGGSS